MYEFPKVKIKIMPEDYPLPDNIREAAWVVAVALHRKWQLKTPLTRLVKRSELSPVDLLETKPKTECAG